MEIHFKIIGVLLMALALVHIIFPKYFKWNDELKSLSLINRQMMIVHTFFIALVVFLMGLLCLTSATELIETKLGKTISLGFGVFWGIRLFVQFFGYSSKLWKGKTFETMIHIIFSGLWIYLSAVFWINYLE
ncbi:hypothetical protein [Sinomicrobium weinanense]|uniref:Uncharacterized protein n=1 Tax=Sinomicrobium weinanense TaxID=2842200 RepID=A0A926JUI5_9FLAO|nr:hypothetical protein [Sinomicrobium weinanense]MBC9797777.1 hypothetical protein [Sinomicrobium weinanense]MBU3122404.1 hypothetical protein [Sinomicrobium weinanense]